MCISIDCIKKSRNPPLKGGIAVIDLSQKSQNILDVPSTGCALCRMCLNLCRVPLVSTGHVSIVYINVSYRDVYGSGYCLSRHLAPSITVLDI